MAETKAKQQSSPQRKSRAPRPAAKKTSAAKTATTAAKKTAPKSTTAKPKATKPKTTPRATAKTTSKLTSAGPIPSIPPIPMLSADDMQKYTAMPEMLKTASENGIKKSRAACQAAMDAVDGTAEALETSLTAAGDNAKAINKKLLDMANANIEAGFAFAKALASSKDITGAIDAQTSFMREQISTATKNTAEIRKLTTEFVEKSSEPIKAQMSKSWDKIHP